jgi:hypothetical protein
MKRKEACMYVLETSEKPKKRRKGRQEVCNYAYACMLGLEKKIRT